MASNTGTKAPAEGTPEAAKPEEAASSSSAERVTLYLTGPAWQTSFEIPGEGPTVDGEETSLLFDRDGTSVAPSKVEKFTKIAADAGVTLSEKEG